MKLSDFFETGWLWGFYFWEPHFASSLGCAIYCKKSRSNLKQVGGPGILQLCCLLLSPGKVLSIACSDRG